MENRSETGTTAIAAGRELADDDGGVEPLDPGKLGKISIERTLKIPPA